MKPFFRIFFGVFVLLLILCQVSCKKKEKTKEVIKEVVVYQETTYKWKKIKNFSNMGSELIRNAGRASGGFVYFVGYDYDGIYDSTDNSISFNQGNRYDLQSKPLMTNEFYTQAGPNGITITPHNNLPGYPSSYTEKTLFLNSYDSNFLQIAPFNNPYAICSNTLLLLVYQSKQVTNNYLALKVSYPLVGDELNELTVNVEATKVIRDTLGVSLNHLIGAAGKNLLFVRGNNRNCLLDGNLDTTFINDNYFFGQIFEWQNEYYSVARVKIGSEIKICLVKSSDEGYHWQIVSEDVNPNFERVYFNNLGGHLVANSFGNQLFEVTITSNSISGKELVNEGLDGVKIVALAYANNKVFIATGTGVFERSLSDIIEYK